MAESKYLSARLVKIADQPSWRLTSSTVQAHVTQNAGQLAPVTFDRCGRCIEPMAIAPWHDESLSQDTPPLLRGLRGDFFCMPFGGNDTVYRNEKYPPHGETANAGWKLQSLTQHDHRVCLHLRLQTKIRQGHVDKRIMLVDGHDAVYSQHVVSEMRGKMSFGHHATLKFPDEEGSGLLSTSPFEFGMTMPVITEDPAQGGYCALAPGYRFRSLKKVKLATGDYTDLSRYPARRGYEDIAILVTKPCQPFAWTAVSFPRQRYVWFALKDPQVLHQTLMWMSNGGRHYAPWSGRHVNVMGLEEVTSYFHYGLAESVKPNVISNAGSPTCVTMSSKRPLVVNYIMAAVPTPAGFDKVRRILPIDDGRVVRLISESGKSIQTPVDTSFLQSKPLNR